MMVLVGVVGVFCLLERLVDILTPVATGARPFREVADDLIPVALIAAFAVFSIVVLDYVETRGG